MRISNKTVGWKFYTALFAFFALAIVAIDPTFDRNPFSQIKKSTLNGLIKGLGLSGVNLKVRGMEPGSVPGVLGNAIKKTISGEYPADLEAIEIDIKMKHLTKIRDERNRALKLEVMAGQKSYPAKIQYKGETYRANIRLKGDMTDHWSGADRWSFRINLKDGKTILGMSRFSIHKPPSRQLPYDHMFQAWMRSIGNMAPRHEYVRVNFNGDYWGVMNVEEHMTRHMIELNGRKEAPIFKMGSEMDWSLTRMNRSVGKEIRQIRKFSNFGRHGIALYNSARYADDPVQRAYFSYAVELLRQIQVGNINIENAIDVDDFSRALIAAVAWNNTHAIHPHNIRIYFNPYTLKLEPVTTDQGAVKTPSKKIGSALIFNALLRSETFYARYEENFAAVKKSIPSLNIEYEKICSVFPLDCPSFKFDQLNDNMNALEKKGPEYFRNRLKKAKKPTDRAEAIKSFEPMPINDKIKFPRHVMGEYFSSGRLVLWNLLPHVLTLESAKLNCKGNSGCKEQTLVAGPVDIRPGFDGVFPTQTEFKVPADLRLGKNIKIEIRTRLGKENKKDILDVALLENLENPLDRVSKTAPAEVLTANAFITVEGKVATVRPGTWVVKHPILVPAGYSLSVGPGTTLKFRPDAYILSHGPVNMIGSADAPVRLMAAGGESWSGMYVVEAGGSSRLEHVEISNTRAFTQGILNLTGGVTFYRAPVTIENVVFNGTRAEDALNTVHSKFTVRNTTFNDAVSDAFDTDFSNGEISSTTFTNIGGDGLDTSGSIVTGNNLVFEKIFDKGVSAGEGSTVNLNGVDASDVGTALAAKDGSLLEVSNLVVNNASLFAGMAYIKKPFYGPGRLLISDTELGLENFFNQLNSELVVNGTSIPGRDLDVDKLYDTGPMQKIGKKNVQEN